MTGPWPTSENFPKPAEDQFNELFFTNSFAAPRTIQGFGQHDGSMQDCNEPTYLTGIPTAPFKASLLSGLYFYVCDLIFFVPSFASLTTNSLMPNLGRHKVSL